MEEESGPAIWIPAALPVDAVPTAYVEHPTVVWLDRRKLTRHKRDSLSVAAKPIAGHSPNDTTELGPSRHDALLPLMIASGEMPDFRMLSVRANFVCALFEDSNETKQEPGAKRFALRAGLTRAFVNRPLIMHPLRLMPRKSARDPCVTSGNGPPLVHRTKRQRSRYRRLRNRRRAIRRTCAGQCWPSP